MNKKITSSALAALMIAGSTSFTAFAAMANGTVVIGDKAFDLAYANDAKNTAEITNAVVAANGVVYVKDFSGKWISNTTGAAVDASVIPAVTYKNAAGVVTEFDAKDMDKVVTSTEASAIALTPDGAGYQQVGKSQVLTSKVTGVKDGATVNIAGVEVTFVIDGNFAAGNENKVLKAVTDVNGVATVSYERSNNGTDTVNAYITSKPEVRKTAQIFWNVSTNAIIFDQTDAKTLANADNRTYTFVAYNTTTGKTLAAGTQLRVNFLENFADTPTRDNDNFTTINGAQVTNNGASALVTVDASGRGSFTVSGSDVKVTPVVFFDDGDQILENTEVRGAAGSVTFATAKYNVAVTALNTDSSVAINGQKVYKVKVTDINGLVVTNQSVNVGISENLDITGSNDTNGKIAWYDNAGTTLATKTGSGYAANATETVTLASIGLNQVTTSFATDANGEFTFAVGNTAGVDVTGRVTTPIVWVDRVADNARGIGEEYALGTPISWVDPVTGGGSLSNATAYNAPGVIGTTGARTFTYTPKNQSGGLITGATETQTVTFTVRNTGTNNMNITSVSGAESPAVAGGGVGTVLAPNQEITYTTTTTHNGTNQTANIVVDSTSTGSAEVTAQVVGFAATKAKSSVSWLTAAPAVPAPTVTTSYVVSGEVIDIANGISDTDGVGTYTIKTTAGEILTIAFDASAGHTLQLLGGISSASTFEDKLSKGDMITFTNDTTGTSVNDVHNITVNND